MSSAQIQDQIYDTGRHENLGAGGEVTPSGAGAGAEDATARATETANGNGAASLLKSQPPQDNRPPLFSDDEEEDENDENASEVSIPSDEVSPNVSVPPYWTHPDLQSPQPPQQQSQHLLPNGQTSRRRRGGDSSAANGRPISTASAESVLPPGAITLQDNERDDSDEDEMAGRRSNSSDLYGRDRNRACWAHSVQVTDYVMVNGGTTNIGAFVVWNIKVETLSGSRINIRKRYSEFDDLRKKLVKTFPNFEAAVPALPPKSVLKRFHPRFLEKRRAGLQYFLNCILLNPEFSGSPVLKEFLFS
ncbi:hypothetical protein VTJ04DRAFT_1777 [Mycothermus thermophilus]|uniref:uncharacterized protein n=1 Tax=Humicola insolens TaxID=85995 RepID=UPI0037420E5E